MHKMTPIATAFRAYSAGGARALIDKIDDEKLMQESNDTQGMNSESFPAMEAPQNYGFTSVVADATKAANGLISGSAESFLSFIGGNRSFPVASIMDDRRHRLLNLAKDAAKGAVALFGQKEWGQQFLNTEKGMFMTGNTEKKMRLQLVENKNGQKQQSQSGGGGSGGGKSVARRIINPPGAYRNKQGKLVIRSEDSGIEFDVEELPQVGTLADSGGSSGSGSSGSGQQTGKATGQKTLHKEKSETYVDMTKDAVHSKRGNGQHMLTDKKAVGYHGDETKSFLTDENHTHIRFQDNRIWVDKSGCWSSKPIQVKQDPYDQGGGEGEEGEGGDGGTSGNVSSASPPLNIASDGNMSLAYSAPLAVQAPAATLLEGVTEQAAEPDSLYLKFVYPLQLDISGNLTCNFAGLAPLASPAFTGAPTAPTVATVTDSSTKIATTAFVQAALAEFGPGVLGSMAYQDANAVAITGGTINGIVIDGGTF